MPKILIIDDDHMLQKLYSTILTYEGFAVETANDGAEGLIKAELYKPDLIVVDMLMPNMDGLQFLRSYKPLQTHPPTKTIMFSNNDYQTWVHEAMALGAHQFMMKFNFSAAEFINLIRDTLALADDEYSSPVQAIGLRERSLNAGTKTSK